MSETKDFLDEDFMGDEAPVEAIEQAPEPVEDASKGPTRGPDGKFVKAEAEAQASQVEQGAKTAVEADGIHPSRHRMNTEPKYRCQWSRHCARSFRS